MAVAALERNNPFALPGDFEAPVLRNAGLEMAGLILFCGLLYWTKENLSGTIQQFGWVILGAIFLFVAYRNLVYGLCAFVAAIGLSPDSVGAPNVRLEDYMFPVLFALWWLRHSGRRDALVESDVFFYIRLYLVILVISTMRGWMVDQVWRSGEMVKEELVWPYFIKYVECFFFFWLVLNNVKEKEDLAILLVSTMLACSVVGAMGLYQRQELLAGPTLSPIIRIGGPVGETPNILGAYLMMHLMLAFPMLFIVRNQFYRVLLLFFVAAVAVPLLFTYSRTSFISMVIGLIVTMLFVNIRYSLIILGLAVFIPIFFPIGMDMLPLPEDVTERYRSIFSVFSISGPLSNPFIENPDLMDAMRRTEVSSWAARIVGWHAYYAGSFSDYPVLGQGVGSINLGVDSELVKRFFEAGLIGLIAFLLLMLRLARTAVSVIKDAKEPLYKAFAIGYIGCMSGMMVHAIGACSLSTIRTAEFFWVLSGMLVATRHLVRKEKEVSTEEEDDMLELRFTRPKPVFTMPKPGLRKRFGGGDRGGTSVIY